MPEVPANTLVVGRAFYPDGEVRVIVKIDDRGAVIEVFYKSPAEVDDSSIEADSTEYGPGTLVTI